MSHGEAKRPLAQRAIVEPAVVFDPSRMASVLVEVLRADVVVLATDHPPKAS